MPRSKRSPGRRVGWSKLTADYRGRIERAGITRSQWEAGADLRAARGKAPAPPAYAAPEELRTDLISGQATMHELERARDWTESALAPAWTAGLDADVAVALSELPRPSRWADVIFTPAADGEPWTMHVVMKGQPVTGVIVDRNGNEHATTAYDYEIQIPGGGEAGSGAKQVMDLLTFGPAGEEDEWEGIDFDLTGTT